VISGLLNDVICFLLDHRADYGGRPIFIQVDPWLGRVVVSLLLLAPVSLNILLCGLGDRHETPVVPQILEAL